MKWLVYWLVITIGLIGILISFTLKTNSFVHPVIIGQLGGLWFVAALFLAKYIVINWKDK